MTKEQLADMAEAVKKDMLRYGTSQNGGIDESTDVLCRMLQFAVWHLRGQPSYIQRREEFIERNS